MRHHQKNQESHKLRGDWCQKSRHMLALRAETVTVGNAVGAFLQSTSAAINDLINRANSLPRLNRRESIR